MIRNQMNSTWFLEIEVGYAISDSNNGPEEVAPVTLACAWLETGTKLGLNEWTRRDEIDEGIKNSWIWMDLHPRGFQEGAAIGCKEWSNHRRKVDFAEWIWNEVDFEVS